MMHFKTYLDKYDWDIECYITTDSLEINKIMCRLRQLDCSDKIMVKAYKILEDQINSGFAYTNSKLKSSLMIINMSTSMDEFINTYNHEKNHIEMHICEAFNIDPFSEEAADLSGQIAQAFYFAMLHSLL